MDSGIGGLPYLDAARRYLPAQAFVYLADREGFPYGSKGREEVEAIVLDRVRRLIASWKPRAIVIACNTASQAALAAVRAAHPGMPVIGTVPAIKPAAERSRRGSIGVLATEGTISDPYLDDLVARFATGTKVSLRGAQELVDFVELRLVGASSAERREAVLPHALALVEAGVDVIVLACTHFLHLADDIADCATELSRERGGGAVEVIDSREGVARRLARVLAESGQGPGSQDPGRGAFLLSGSLPWEERYTDFARLHDLDGPLPLDRCGR
jgi:glutamate racemase